MGLDLVVRLALDTGAILTLVQWEVLVSLGYDPASVSELVEISTASAVEFVPRVLVGKVEALGQVRQNFPVLCHSLPPSITVDGLLGLDFLREQRLIVDFRDGFIALE